MLITQEKLAHEYVRVYIKFSSHKHTLIFIYKEFIIALSQCLLLNFPITLTFNVSCSPT